MSKGECSNAERAGADVLLLQKDLYQVFIKRAGVIYGVRDSACYSDFAGT